MSKANTTIVFRDTGPRYDTVGGSPLALMVYKFDVGGREVSVQVESAAIRTKDGSQLSPEEVKLAAKTLIELSEQDCSSPNATLVLDSNHMSKVAGHLGWQNRFHQDG
jgi:protein-tyrosine-phosphatase